MQTPDLIEQLATNLRPVSEHAALSRLALGVIAGAVIALSVVCLTLGPRGDLATAVLSVPFWRKTLFALSITGAALCLCVRLGRPDGALGVWPWILASPFLVLVVLALLEIRQTPPEDRVEVWLGKSAVACPWIIGALALPIFVGVLFAFRRLAPTRQRFAGFCAGCLAGGAATVVYVVHCPESAASFVATWYSAGILLPAMLGLLLGPRVLRW
jgi:hypothetical protein